MRGPSVIQRVCFRSHARGESSDSTRKVLASSATSFRDTSEAPQENRAKAFLQHDALAVMPGSYEAPVVIISILVAMLASYVALGLAGRVRSGSHASRLGWLAGGAIVMGLGIWS